MVEAVAAAFAKEPRLKEVGLGFLGDHSGKLFTKKPSLKDAIFAVVKATNGASRLSWPHPADLQEGQDFQGPQAEPFEKAVCKDKGDKDHDDDDSNDGVSRLASQLQGLRLLSKDSVFADLATWLPEPSKGFPLSSQYAGAFDAEDVDGIHEPPEDHEPKPNKAGNKKATKPKSKAGSKKAGPKSKAGSKETGPESKAGSEETGPESKAGFEETGPETEELDPDLIDQYVPNLYGEKRLTYIATHAPQHGNKEAANMWNSSLQKARLLAGVSLRELKKRKFVPKEATENPFVKIVKQAKLAAVGGA
ncbi:unnamed protein product [Symbiodinium sp. CCMP2592]|nr:unnamed protein product [Symbiodinium sp. CCMP2592]